MADIIVCAVGGGGILAGLAAAIKLSGHTSCRLYGVEPTGSQTMYQSFQHGCPVAMPVKTIASGLAPPFAGQHTFLHCRQFVDDIVLVADEEIISAMWKLYDGGLKVEPSGAAALAAVLTGKIPDVSGKNVVVVVSGGNVTPEELCGMK
ncbi:PREDICTED: serine racemase-like [Priapulus caudatus]|uniref:L-serine deaminase n=1 Tax=Priapulus caudatus TaxID=37621 RepID=A0ABM1EQV6_PRICU|nr:PREDICTED: serine racemase-like [Priapulus caudatus]